MRKNGVIREIQEISGGVCAPNGFSCLGIENGKENLAFIRSQVRGSIAVVSRREKNAKGFISCFEGRDSVGQAKLLAVSSFGVDAFEQNYLTAIRESYRKIRSRFGVLERDVRSFLTGKVRFGAGKEIFTPELTCTEFSTDTKTLYPAFGEGDPIEYACSFHLGDIYPKIGFIGGIGKGENAQSGLIVLTTDVNISTEMLQKALISEVKNTYALCCIPCGGLPSDTVVILANGQAGNAIIDQDDSEYEKFCLGLRLASQEFCRRFVRKKAKDRVVECIVQNARSNLQAREIAEKIAISKAVHSAIEKGENCFDGILCAVANADQSVKFSKLSVSFSCEKATLKAMDVGEKHTLNKPRLKEILTAKESYITVNLNAGNYPAFSWFCISDEELKEELEKN